MPSGRAGAHTDHSCVMFDINVEGGTCKKGTSNSHWYPYPSPQRSPAMLTLTACLSWAAMYSSTPSLTFTPSHSNPYCSHPIVRIPSSHPSISRYQLGGLKAAKCPWYAQVPRPDSYTPNSYTLLIHTISSHRAVHTIPSTPSVCTGVRRAMPSHPTPSCTAPYLLTDLRTGIPRATPSRRTLIRTPPSTASPSPIW
jgi:hypothetical protein